MQSTGQTSTQAVSFVPTHGSVMMYATLMSSKPTKGDALDVQPRSITRPSRTPVRAAGTTMAVLAATAIAVWACTNLRAAAQALGAGPSTAARSGASTVPSTVLTAGWREAPEYVGLFAPSSRRDAYRAYVSAAGIEATLTQILMDPGVLHPPGAWTAQAMIPYDAFGLSGSYNRWRVAGLYRSRRVQVVRGPRLEQGRLESWTLVAPFPDQDLQRLEPGTLIIVLRMPSD
jgi:hypothetical protein